MPWPNDLPPAGDLAGRVIHAVSKLSAKEDPAELLAPLPRWSSEAALLRALDGLRRGTPPAEVLALSADALLAPPNPEVGHFPLSPLEMLQLAQLAPAAAQPFALALAAALGHNDKQALALSERLGPPPLCAALKAVLAFRRDDRPGVKATARALGPLGKQPFGQFLLAWAKPKPARAKAMLKLAQKPEMGAYALGQLQQDGLLKPALREQARARFPHHPRVMAALSPKS